MLSMLSARRRSLELSLEADDLELQFGRSGAIEEICERILRADRGERRRLYRLHDELTRRSAQEADQLPCGVRPAEASLGHLVA